MDILHKLVGDDNRFLALVSVNLSAAAIAGFIQKFTPYMNAVLLLAQLVIALYTVVHIIKKSLKSHDSKNTKRLGRNRDARRVTRNARRLRDLDSEES
jgi:hypothetical protein